MCWRIGSDIIYDEEVITCYERLRDMYVAGGYSSLNSSAASETDRYERCIAMVSPTWQIE